MDHEQLKYENFILNKLNKFLLTESLLNMENYILDFIGKMNQHNFKQVSKTNEIINIDDDDANGISDENNDFMQILRLRHINLAK